MLQRVQDPRKSENQTKPPVTSIPLEQRVRPQSHQPVTSKAKRYDRPQSCPPTPPNSQTPNSSPTKASKEALTPVREDGNVSGVRPPTGPPPALKDFPDSSPEEGKNVAVVKPSINEENPYATPKKPKKIGPPVPPKPKNPKKRPITLSVTEKNHYDIPKTRAVIDEDPAAPWNKISPQIATAPKDIGYMDALNQRTATVKPASSLKQSNYQSFILQLEGVSKPTAQKVEPPTVGNIDAARKRREQESVISDS